MDLVIEHVREWGWRFTDDLLWRKTDNGVPGGWPNRFKNAHEPVFHFTRQKEIKFRPRAVGHESADYFDYSRDNPKSTSGSGLLGTGKWGGMAADGAANGSAMLQTQTSDEDGRSRVRPIGEIIPFAGNARTHSAEQAAQVVKSIREFGRTNPILVGADDVIIACHARLEAARTLKMTEVPVIVLPHLSDTCRQVEA
jgi:hypothetical protein